MNKISCPLCYKILSPKPGLSSVRCDSSPIKDSLSTLSHFYASPNEHFCYDTFDLYIYHNNYLINLFTSFRPSDIWSYISTSNILTKNDIIISNLKMSSAIKLNYYIDPSSPNLVNKLLSVINFS